MKVEYIPLGGAGEGGASCGFLRIGDRRVLIDAGMRPSARVGQDRLPALDQLIAEPPEAILVTHAHTDHAGALPLASALVPTVPISCTETTLLLTRLLLADSVRVMEAEHLAQEGETPLYTAEVVERTLARVRLVGACVETRCRPVLCAQEYRRRDPRSRQRLSQWPWPRPRPCHL